MKEYPAYQHLTEDEETTSGKPTSRVDFCKGTIKEMPSKEILEKFLNGMVGGEVEVVFDFENGQFVYVSKKKG